MDPISYEEEQAVLRLAEAGDSTLQSEIVWLFNNRPREQVVQIFGMPSRRIFAFVLISGSENL